ncbi:DEDD exonuclease domain-containing protein [Actinomyces marmotae]|uniref:DEDD exonuclease domain-containing protein n=1 Tax=Actinomyces marmotae TaxID=2737173 RepID=A0A6M8B1F5_9ACTO|nr:DEDD exonuclease domain-containing protein [Actinomyces marmotae]QKD79622.1 DEDD exonuclease domain-containing protein [Actinomyces marmotae]
MPPPTRSTDGARDPRPAAAACRPWGAAGTQSSFEDMGTPLREATFVVVDLETTGAGPGAHAITEIGAVRVRGGIVDDEFSTLANPGAPIPAQITLLTGITNAMVATAPPLAEALAAFLAWSRRSSPADGGAAGPILVAHNARFDVGHLRGAARALGLPWDEPRVVDTLALARRAWSRADVPNHRLGTLASFVGSPTRPTHRALDDARATVDVLHAALEALAPLGITHVEDLSTAADPVPAKRRAKAHLADPLPHAPGVYQFRSPAGQALYIGSASDLRRRVRSYFTAAEKRGRIARMLDTAVSVRHIETPTEIEARVRELRLIAELDPPLNRRSRAPQRQPWLRVAQGRGGLGPRLALTTALPTDDAPEAVGPFPSRASGLEAQRAAESVLRLSAWDGTDLRQASVHDSPADARTARQALAGRIDLVAAPILERVAALAERERYEEAGAWTSRLRSLLLGARRAETARPLLACPHLIAARRREAGGWELVAVRWGKLAGSLVSPPGADPRPYVDDLRATAQVVDRPERVGQAASVEETLLLASWVLDDGARLVEVDGDPSVLAWPIGAAARHQRVIDAG